MARVFISFLGIGGRAKTPGYDEATYVWPEKSSEPVTCRFAQTAILKAFDAGRDQNMAVDRVILFCTQESQDKHLDLLTKEFEAHLGQPPQITVPDLVPTDMSADNQWGWFENLLENVGVEDRLVIDFTHGMRAVPIIFSSAIGFLQRARTITLEHALYAWYDPDNKGKPHPIVDMKAFYVINDWAESVARLTEDADARKLGELAKESRIEALAPLADIHLIDAFQDMTDCIRNADVNNISEKVNAALAQVESARHSAGGSARLMLDLVRDKFSGLSACYPPSGRYDQPYFDTQIKIIDVLMEHRLFMQAFTVMRELVGSIGMAGLSGKYGNREMSSKKGRRYRRFADIFIRMVSIAERPGSNERGWEFADQDAKDKDTLYPWFLELKEAGIEQELRCIVKELVNIRNGFDHAWTSEKTASPDIEKKGKEYLTVLHNIVRRMAEQQLFSKEEDA